MAARITRSKVQPSRCLVIYERHNMTIGLAIYDDRVEIEDPGMLPRQIDVAHIEQAHYSLPHNPRMAKTMSKRMSKTMSKTN